MWQIKQNIYLSNHMEILLNLHVLKFDPFILDF